MLKIRNLEAGYGNLKVLKHVSMHVMKGEIVTIIGANGSGKSTLVRLINGLVAEGFELGVPPPGWTETIVYNHLNQPRELVKSEAVTSLFA